MLAVRGEKFSSLQRVWSGTVVCMATGPSITPEQVERVRKFKTIAINDNYRLAPWADVLYFADFRWWQWHRDKPEFKTVTSTKVAIDNCNASFGDDVHVLRNLSLSGTNGRISTQQDGIYTGQNSGYQAINVAVLLGAKRIILLGYDMRCNGKSHWFGDHPIKTNEAIFLQFRQEFERMVPTAKAMGIEIVNATPGSELEAFPRVKLESVLANP